MRGIHGVHGVQAVVRGYIREHETQIVVRIKEYHHCSFCNKCV